MGSRIVYAIKSGDGLAFRARGGGAEENLDSDLAVGPGIALRWLAALEEDYDTGGWDPDPVPAGGCVVDTERRHLLFFNNLNAFPIAERFAYRHAMLRAYERAWAPWTVAWAYDGLTELAAYTDSALDDWEPRYYAPDDDGPRFHLLTIGDQQFTLPAGGGLPWHKGEKLLADLGTPATPAQTPISGLHLDPAERTAALWTIEPLAGLLDDWPRLWPGWHLTFLEDRPPVPVHLDDAFHTRKLAARVTKFWPAETRFHDPALGRLIGLAPYFDAATADEIDAAVALLLGPHAIDSASQLPPHP